jgi:hypothetical protein
MRLVWVCGSVACSCSHRNSPQVFVTIILSYFVFHDELVMFEYVGMGLILLGMFSVSYANHLEKKPEAVPEEAKGLLNNSINQDWK